MNLMMYGLPVLASVDPGSEVARIVNASGGGWVVDNSDPSHFASQLREVTASRAELERRAAAAYEYAQRNFTIEAFAASFDEVLRDVVSMVGAGGYRRVAGQR
jgi:colanic acid biosynthesis glycosyl transferase WcaI